MADAGWGQGRPDSGILQVLTAYVMQGGQLYGARRWPDNPLTLTHVRWQGPEGANLEAFRQQVGDEDDAPAEREVWVNLALHFSQTPSHYGASGAEAPWIPLMGVDREKASQWVQRLRQQMHQYARPGSMPSPYGAPSMPLQVPSRYESMPPAVPMPSIPPDMPPSMGRPMTPASPRPPSTPSYSPQPSIPGLPPMPPSHGGSETSQWTGAYQRPAPENTEVAVLPCVEIELPPAINSAASADYRRDFARDVALHFGRAARTIAQVREVRGWMRGDRLILAARLVVGLGARLPTRAEMDNAAHLLAQALAPRTLPYAQLTFADPGEWVQGAPLPE